MEDFTAEELTIFIENNRVTFDVNTDIFPSLNDQEVANLVDWLVAWQNREVS